MPDCLNQLVDLNWWNYRNCSRMITHFYIFFILYPLFLVCCWVDLLNPVNIGLNGVKTFNPTNANTNPHTSTHTGQRNKVKNRTISLPKKVFTYFHNLPECEKRVSSNCCPSVLILVEKFVQEGDQLQTRSICFEKQSETRQDYHC